MARVWRTSPSALLGLSPGSVEAWVIDGELAAMIVEQENAAAEAARREQEQG